MNELERAIKLIKNDDIVAMPTETVYGLAGSIYSPRAIHKIFATKERPFFDPLIVHVSSIEMAKDLSSDWNELCSALAEKFWPGPLTIVLKKKDHINELITSGLDSVGIRMPNHPLALELISKTNCPLAAPSANKFKKVSPTSKAHVISEFGNDVFVLDGDDCEIGIESTVISIQKNNILIYRPGMITKDMLEDSLKAFNVKCSYASSPVAPGQLEHHYMPSIPIILLWDCEIDSNSIDPKLLISPYIWGIENNPTAVARQLYARFREAQELCHSSIIIKLSKEFKDLDSFHGILNRLSKAKSLEFIG